jgi:hypothetical protein
MVELFFRFTVKRTVLRMYSFVVTGYLYGPADRHETGKSGKLDLLQEPGPLLEKS